MKALWSNSVCLDKEKRRRKKNNTSMIIHSYFPPDFPDKRTESKQSPDREQINRFGRHRDGPDVYFKPQHVITQWQHHAHWRQVCASETQNLSKRLNDITPDASCTALLCFSPNETRDRRLKVLIKMLNPDSIFSVFVFLLLIVLTTLALILIHC